MQNHMKAIELQSDWLTQKQDYWACKNQKKRLTVTNLSSKCNISASLKKKGQETTISRK